MIHTEEITKNGRSLRRTWSDQFCIRRDGVLYTGAVDPAELNRVYEETDQKLPVTVEEQLAQAHEALKILGVQP